MDAASGLLGLRRRKRRRERSGPTRGLRTALWEEQDRPLDGWRGVSKELTGTSPAGEGFLVGKQGPKEREVKKVKMVVVQIHLFLTYPMIISCHFDFPGSGEGTVKCWQPAFFDIFPDFGNNLETAAEGKKN